MTECNVILCEEQNYLCHSDFSGGNIPAHFDKVVPDTQDGKGWHSGGSTPLHNRYAFTCHDNEQLVIQ